MADLAELLEDPAVAAWVARAVTRFGAELGRNGVSPPPFHSSLLTALDVAAGEAGLGGRFASATASVSVDVVGGFTSVRIAAAACQVSEQYVRRLANDKRIRAEKWGRDWRVNQESLENVLRRTA